MKDNDDISDEYEEDFNVPLQSGFSMRMNKNEISDLVKPTVTKQKWSRVLPYTSLNNKNVKSSSEITDDHNKTIIHIDIDCFYAQVEMIADSSLRMKPLGIQQKYLLVTCNYKARERGVRKLMSIADAKSKCPELVIINGEDLTKYREMSENIFSLLKQHCALVEKLGMDETFLDVSAQVNERLHKTHDIPQVEGHLYECQQKKFLSGQTDQCTCGCHRRLIIGSHIAAELREALKTHLGITSCAGIAHNKLLSKLVAGTHKPNQQTTLFPEHAQDLLFVLKPRNIPGIGHSTAKKLQGIGINSLQELISCPTAVLNAEFGPISAIKMKNLASGIDHSEVVLSGAPKSVSDEDSFQKCSSTDEASTTIKSLIKNLLPRLKDELHSPQTVRLTIRRYNPQVTDYSTRNRRESKQTNLPPKFFTCLDLKQRQQIVLKTVMELFHKLINDRQPFHLTLINVCFTNFRVNSRKDNIFFRKSSSAKRKRENEVQDDSLDTSFENSTSLHLTSCKFNKQDCFSSESLDNVDLGERTNNGTRQSNINQPNSENFPQSNSTTSEIGLYDVTENKASSSQKCVDQKQGGPTEEYGARSSLVPSAEKELSLSSYSPDVSLQSVAVKTCHFAENKTSTKDSFGNSTIPNDIDPKVFSELPLNIQKELILQWKQTGKRKDNETAKKRDGILKYFKK